MSYNGVVVVFGVVSVICSPFFIFFKGVGHQTECMQAINMKLKLTRSRTLAYTAIDFNREIATRVGKVEQVIRIALPKSDGISRIAGVV